MKITVVTNSYQRNLKLVERSLLASLQQNPPIDHLIFIDQNPTPLCLNSEITSDPRFTHLNTKSRCVSAARNEAIIPANTDWLVFCDDDGFFANDYVACLNAATTKFADIEIFAGSIIRDDNGDYYSPRHKVGGDLQKFRNTKLLMGSNFAIRPRTFSSLNKFDTNFGAGSYWGSGEETDFAWKAFFENVPMKYAPELRVFHIRPYAENWTNSIHKAFRYGRGKGALVSKWLYNGKFIVLYELGEMYVVPTIQIVRAIATLKWKNVPIYMASLVGRTWGLFAYSRNQT